MAALLFLYQHVLKIDIGQLDAVRARRPTRVPLVLSQAEVAELLRALAELPTTEPYGLMGQRTTMIDTRVMQKAASRVRSPLDRQQVGS